MRGTQENVPENSREIDDEWNCPATTGPLSALDIKLVPRQQQMKREKPKGGETEGCEWDSLGIARAQSDYRSRVYSHSGRRSCAKVYIRLRIERRKSFVTARVT